MSKPIRQLELDLNSQNLKNNKLKAIDLFAGIGGIRLGFEQAFGKSIEFVFSSEIDKFAQQTYYANFNEMPHGDITQIDERDIPPHDIILAGFPCQAFSVAGLRKGFEDTRGTLFFDVARIAAYHKPKLIFLENVKGFVNHDKGNTFKVVKETLEDMGYKVYAKVLNAKDFGVPQNRERIYIVAMLGDVEFEFPKAIGKVASLRDILEAKPDIKPIIRGDIELKEDFNPEQNLLDELPNKTLQIGKVNKGGQGERIYSTYGHACTLSAHGGGVGAKTGLYFVDGIIRRLTPRECARVQGFSDSFIVAENKNQAYKQFGNSVAVSVVKEIAKSIKKGYFMNKKQKIGSYTAKGGFKNEAILVSKFSNYQEDKDAQKWLGIMGYDYKKLSSLKAILLPARLSKAKMLELGVSEDGCEVAQGFKKADLQIILELNIDGVIYRENISAKKANIGAGFNQVDKRAVDKYAQMWNMPSDIIHILKLFTGEITPNGATRDKRRMFLDEFSCEEVEKIIDFFDKNRVLIISDILRGRGAFAAEWMLVSEYNGDEIRYIIKDINSVCNFFARGDIELSPRGSLKIGRVTMQRKGGAPDPTSLQFKINPLELFNDGL